MLEKVWRKGNPLTLSVRMYIGANTMENSMEVPQKTKNRTTVWSSNPTPGHLSGEKYNLKRIYTPQSSLQHYVHTVAKTWKQPKCPSAEDWIKKMWYIYTMEYYSAIAMNETVLFAATWMDIETHTKWSKSEVEDRHHMLPNIWEMRKKNETNELICRTEPDLQTLKNLWLPKGTSGGRRELGF